MPVTNKDLYDFLMNPFPTGVKHFGFNIGNESLTPIDYYFKPLVFIGSKLGEYLTISSYKMTGKQFWKLVQAYRNIKGGAINFTHCKLETSFVPDLSVALKGFRLRRLDFDG